ncbi:MAG: SPRY domain-containing protein, partial [Chitinophagaceae bacterium]
KPKKYSGTYGTNGFYLDFKNATSTTTIGYDVSGNSTHFTANNMSVTAGTNYDIFPDSPTPSSKVSDTGLGGQVIGNYCTWNNVDKTMSGTNNVFSNGGLTVSESTALGSDGRGTMMFTSGKWYFEGTVSGQIGGSHLIGINIANERRNAYSGIYRSSGDTYSLANPAVVTSYAGYTSGDVIGVAFDVDNGKCWFRKNGTWLTGDPAAGTTPTFSFTAGTPIVPYYAFDNVSATKIWYTNFGQRTYTYSAPTGFKAMCTGNFPNPNVANPRKYHDTALIMAHTQIIVQ